MEPISTQLEVASYLIHFDPFRERLLQVSNLNFAASAVGLPFESITTDLLMVRELQGIRKDIPNRTELELN